jgi:hypothetical protein
MTLAKVVRKGSYQGVPQWGISTGAEITPSKATAEKWARAENAVIGRSKKAKPTTAKLNQVNVVQGEHKCKLHNYEHFYVRHTCGHEFCPQSWLYCPRCHGSHEGNRIGPIGRSASE